SLGLVLRGQGDRERARGHGDRLAGVDDDRRVRGVWIRGEERGCGGLGGPLARDPFVDRGGLRRFDRQSGIAARDVDQGGPGGRGQQDGAALFVVVHGEAGRGQRP